MEPKSQKQCLLMWVKKKAHSQSARGPALSSRSRIHGLTLRGPVCGTWHKASARKIAEGKFMDKRERQPADIAEH